MRCSTVACTMTLREYLNVVCAPQDGNTPTLSWLPHRALPSTLRLSVQNPPRAPSVGSDSYNDLCMSFLLFVLLRCPRTINIPCPRRHVAFRPLDRQDLREAAEFPMCIVRARASRSPRCDAGRVPWTAVIPSVTSQATLMAICCAKSADLPTLRFPSILLAALSPSRALPTRRQCSPQTVIVLAQK